MGNFGHPRKVTAVVLSAVVLAACSDVPPPACPAGLAPMTRAELFFGWDMPGGAQVSEQAWQGFVNQEIAPRFPDGFTVQDGWGQWKGKDGVVREPARIMIVVFAGRPDGKLQDIREAYKRRFHQESVLYVEQPVCAGF